MRMTDWAPGARKEGEASTPWIKLMSTSRLSASRYLMVIGISLGAVSCVTFTLLFFLAPSGWRASSLIAASSSILASVIALAMTRRETVVMRETVKRAEELAVRLGDVRESEELVTVEKRKSLVESELFELNRSRAFRLTSLNLNGTRYFADGDWSFSTNLSLLLGRNGYGKTYVLHAIAALLSCNFKAMERMFQDDDDARIVLGVDYAPIRSARGAKTRAAHISFSDQGITSRIGPLPVLAIPGLRFIDKSSTSFGPGQSDNLVRNGAALFLDDRPIVNLVETMIYQLCIDYLQERDLAIPSIRMLEGVVSRLSESSFKFMSISPRPNARFQIMVSAEGRSEHPMPLQRASQGTLSVLALFGLVERFLRELDPVAPSIDVAERQAIVIIDELDAHLHPSWQRRIARILIEAFPNVQFIASSHSPLVVGGRLKCEVAVLRKDEDKRFSIHVEQSDFIGRDIEKIIEDVFDTRAIDETSSRFNTRVPDIGHLKGVERELRSKREPNDEDKITLRDIGFQLEQISRAEATMKRRMRRDDLDAYCKELSWENERLREQLQQQSEKSAGT